MARFDTNPANATVGEAKMLVGEQYAVVSRIKGMDGSALGCVLCELDSGAKVTRPIGDRPAKSMRGHLLYSLKDAQAVADKLNAKSPAMRFAPEWAL